VTLANLINEGGEVLPRFTYACFFHFIIVLQVAQIRKQAGSWAHNATFDASEPYELQVDSSGASGEILLFHAMGNPEIREYSNGLLHVTLTEMPVYVLCANVAASSSPTRQ
jgi:hypothetical protein